MAIDDNGRPETYVIPPNITDNGNVFNGLIKKKNLFEAIIVASVGFLIWFFIKLFVSSVIVKVVLILPAVLLTLLTLVGLGESSLLEHMIEVSYFNKKKRIIKYKIPRRETEQKKKKKGASY